MGKVRCLCWSPDGNYVVAGDCDGRMGLWQAPNGTECEVGRVPPSTNVLAELHAHAYDVNSVCWSADGVHIMSGSFDGTAKLWRIRERGADVRSAGEMDGRGTDMKCSLPEKKRLKSVR